MDLRHGVALVLVLFGIPSTDAIRSESESISVDAAVTRARGYLERWELSLATIVAEEQYTQSLDEWPDGRRRLPDSPRHRTRQLLSDVLLVRSSRENEWLMFRDVLSVDGDPVRDRQRRFDALFARPDADLLTSARRIADEGARYNLGQLERNVNTPATALTFLRQRYEGSTRFTKVSTSKVDGAAALQLEFEQNRAPFVIHTPEGRPRPTVGAFWIAPDTGRILRVEMNLTSTVSTLRARGLVPLRSRARVVSKFGPVDGIDVWVPVRMDEEYELSGAVDELVRTEAVYRNHRQFRTSARIVGYP